MSRFDQVEQLRRDAVTRLEAYRYAEADRLLEEAIALCDDEEQAERLALNKAMVLLLFKGASPDLGLHAEIILRRKNPEHAALAARNLQLNYLIANDLERAMKFGLIALREVATVDHPVLKAGVLTDLGGTAMRLSRYDESLRYVRHALAAISSGNQRHRAVMLEHIGYCYVQLGQVQRGIRFIRKALRVFEREGPEEFRCETLLDLCYSYLEAGELDLAKHAAGECVAIANEPRQVRNCHYLQGEIALRCGRLDEARRHFQVLAEFYPGFEGLPDLLFGVDIRSLINLKL